VLRTWEVVGAGGGPGVGLDWLPGDQFFMGGLGVPTEATDLWTDDQSISSFFHGSVGTEIVNTDRVSFRLTADLGWHVNWGNEGSFAAGLSLSLQFKVGSSSRGAH